MKSSTLILALALTACATGPRPNDPRRAFLGSTAAPSEVIAAELAFARMAREKGQWTAFRETATDDALWPSPDWVNVKADLKGAPDPAQAIVWEPDRVVLSCDGSFALSTGPATYPNDGKTRFATIWQRQDDGRYKWVLDQGFDLEATYAKPELIGGRVAECGERRGPPPRARRGLAWQSGQSDDGSLSWTTELRPDCTRLFVVRARGSGGGMEEVFRRTGAPSPTAPESPVARCSA